MTGQNSNLDISWNTIFKIALAIMLLYVVYTIKDILIWFIFAIVISILFNPAIEFLEKKRMPHTVAVISMYMGTFALLAVLIYSVASVLFFEVQQFLQFFPNYFQTLSPVFKGLGIEAFQDLQSFTEAATKMLEPLASNVPSALFSVFGGIFTTFFVITMAVFLSLEQKPIERALVLFFRKESELYILNLWEKCQKKVSSWFYTRIIASLFVGALSYVTFLLFNTRYPLLLGLIAGALNFIPFIGPFITGLMIFFIASLDSFLRSLFVVIAFMLIQQIENNILTPIISKRFMEVPSVLVLAAVVIGGKLWGVMGSLLAIPLFGIMFEFLKDSLKKEGKLIKLPLKF